MKYVVNDQVVLMQPPEGPLAAYIRPFSSWVSERGYRSDSLLQRIRIAVDLSRWLGERALWPPNIQAQHCTQFVRCRARHKRTHRVMRLHCVSFKSFCATKG